LKSKVKLVVLCSAFLAVLLASSVFAFPTSSRLARGQPRYGGTLVWGIITEPPHLVGAGPPTWVYQQVTQHIYNTLVRWNPEKWEWEPELAESWEVKVDEKGRMIITFHLVRNATWHDGKPFTSADVKFTYEEIAPLFNSFIAAMMRDYVEAIETPDNYTVVFIFKHPWAPAFYPGIFCGCATGIMPKHLYEGTDILHNPYNMKPVGTGPWKFKEWKRGEYIILERNENYWKKGIPYLDRIIFKIIPDPHALALAFERGEVDFIWSYGLTFPDAVRLQELIGLGKLPGKKVWFWPSPCGSELTLAFNLHEEGPEPLKDVRVRKAIAAAINRTKIAEVVYLGRVEPLETPLSAAPANSLYYDPTIKQPEYNPELARKLLDEAGYKPGPDGIRFKLRIAVDIVAYPAFLKVAELIRDFLKEVGIEVEIEALETAAWHEKVFKKWDYDMAPLPYCYGPGPSYLIRYFTTRGIARASWTNAAGYSNPEFDELMYKAEREIDKAKQAELVKKALRIMVEDQPAVWLVSRTFINALNLEFSDEYQPGAWENAGGVAYERLERVYWVKAPLVREKEVVREVIKEVPVIPGWVYAVVGVAVIAIIAAIGSVIYITKKRGVPK